ncbi:aminotransferase class I/II-fold pyridoxal phosphate-dependent enzyme [Neptunicella marina]|uniref:8-amino-7-oxononanoate synthase n=1 Tax=Neptunicella marina TaxID=2125989 RepID=A0A8J6IRY6_9ALTE|nr:8-amino-7-oxononanoate synthase [Neptunicella marina]MBC3764308.1 8-amino-7-oxononanoate synthase [Neptunicella marina]
MPFDFIPQQLQSRHDQFLLRERRLKRHCVDFAGNDYLGLAAQSLKQPELLNEIKHYAVGSAASPLVCGYKDIHAGLENYLAQRLNREAVLLFNSGFAANQALCHALMLQGGSIVADKLSHASLIDGAMASSAEFKRFKHNDLSHLQTLLKTPSDNRLVVCEGVYSMDGDRAPLADMAHLAQQHNSWLMVDDAHGFGVLGETGMGSIEQAGLDTKQVPVIMATFGKAAGSAGAFVAGSKQLIEYLVNFARHYVYSTHMSPVQAAITLYNLKRIENEPQLRNKLFSNIELFKSACEIAGINLLPSDTAIQPVALNNAERVLNVSQFLTKAGFQVGAIRYPTVPKGTDRLRITISAAHSEQQIQALVTALADAIKRCA